MGCRCKEIKEKREKRDRIKDALNYIDETKETIEDAGRLGESAAEKAMISVKAVNGSILTSKVGYLSSLIAEVKSKCDEKVSELEESIDELSDEDESYHREEHEKARRRSENNGNSANAEE